MYTDLIIERIKKQHGEGVLKFRVKNPARVTMDINPEIILPVAEYLYRNEGFRFIIASALHSKKGYEIFYHFSHDPSGMIFNVHVLLNGEMPEIESLSNMFNASNWIEREMHELFGINFVNHPNQEKLISEGNWAEGVYPMKKDLGKRS